MVRSLRPLAIATIVFAVLVAILTLLPAILPFLPSGRLLDLMLLRLNTPVLLSVLTSTATLLAIVMGAVAVIATIQRGQRPWSIAFLLLLLLSAYSPVFFAWLRTSETPIYDPPRFAVNWTGYFLILLMPQILSTILAVVVLIYSLRDRRAQQVVAA
ncbi:MAG: hypothetical protein ACM3N4_09280 [Nitrososphaerota archaeon]